MPDIQMVSVIAAVLCCASFVPDAARAIVHKDVAGINLVMYGMFVAGVTCWFVYGLVTAQPSLAVANGITMVLSGVTLATKVRVDVLPKRYEGQDGTCEAIADDTTAPEHV
ncbi:MAG: SemiSWEET family transporter [Atopobiaceae bacterium]|jgi:MtN3 and saliva related transmembrane protein|nr:SemiSWEET family transporter [Atopobiaceae bacterium]MCH4179805.1 SemiSWEET family transporter [Atopobiaceae bacterium]MCH4213556.1 SemiSWEET family transporter [Atopobiaceae bacterium]MCH4229634.1 SemiSWEET family transporter [Atopobiaceae bacterium]MCH4276204.1 SemiSWEET family transporter [Atopobiaceae bacterium]